MKRVSDALGELVFEGIAMLEVPQAVRAGIEWEVFPYVGGDGSILWLVGIGVKVPATGDWHIPFGQLGDPHDRIAVRDLVSQLYRNAQDLADAGQRKALTEGNGHGRSAGGLILPS